MSKTKNKPTVDDEQVAKIPSATLASFIEKAMKLHSPGVTHGPLPAKDITKKHGA